MMHCNITPVSGYMGRILVLGLLGPLITAAIVLPPNKGVTTTHSNVILAYRTGTYLQVAWAAPHLTIIGATVITSATGAAKLC